MQDAVDTLLENLLSGANAPDPAAWHHFGDHGEPGVTCPLFKTNSMCSGCCDHFTRGLFDGADAGDAMEDAYTRFRLTARREVSRPVFRHLAAYACRRCPNNPTRVTHAMSDDGEAT